MTTDRIESILHRTGNAWTQAVCYVALGSRGSAVDVASFARDPVHAVANIRRMSKRRALAVLADIERETSR